MIKKRALPNKPNDRYDICDYCSHKFFVLQLYHEYGVKVDARDKMLQELKKSHNSKKEEFASIRKKHNARKKELKNLRHEQKKSLADQEENIVTLTKLKAKTIEENDANSRELNEIQKQQRNMEDQAGEIEIKIASLYQSEVSIM